MDLDCDVIERRPTDQVTYVREYTIGRPGKDLFCYLCDRKWNKPLTYLARCNGVSLSGSSVINIGTTLGILLSSSTCRVSG